MPKGFTLIELMIAIAILGGLTSIALMSYTSYTKKAVVSNSLYEISSLKAEYEMAVNENYAGLTRLSSIQLDTSQYCNLTTSAPDINTKIAEKALGCNFKNTRLFGENAKIYLTRDAGGEYSCHTENIAQKYLPKSCISE